MKRPPRKGRFYALKYDVLMLDFTTRVFFLIALHIYPFLGLDGYGKIWYTVRSDINRHKNFII